MARKASALNDLLRMATLMPWWASLLSALISFLVFHALSLIEITPSTTSTPNNPIPVPDNLSWILIGVFSTYLQYIVPLIFLMGMIANLVRRDKGDRLLSRSRRRIQSKEQKQTPPPVNDLSWQQFESLLAATFRAQGYQVKHSLPGPDGGVDLTLKKDRTHTLVQAKHWKSQRVGVAVIRELLGSITAAGADKGIIVTSGSFTPDASKLAGQNDIKLVDGQQLAKLLEAETQPGGIETHSTVSKATIECPRCQSSMTKRIAQRGAHAGEQFWGCTRFPQCRGTRPVQELG
ncbi:hypothetical protein CK501_15875 [Halovibrio salipaludis]|uniref:Restriction endonuclease n=1 Tax=Halovibrio salipaludis TaxID=2032626 RepID=A0A2A2EVV8_9GAMM|nr:restriction endonuclease [Halovibrio salipaludis]PAU76413.1 hypothetical protein CK501_15875 [Halovibrio salipaludis]